MLYKKTDSNFVFNISTVFSGRDKFNFQGYIFTFNREIDENSSKSLKRFWSVVIGDVIFMRMSSERHLWSSEPQEKIPLMLGLIIKAITKGSVATINSIGDKGKSCLKPL